MEKHELASTKQTYILLMAWWPDKRTQINYLNYMNQQGHRTQVLLALNKLSWQELQRSSAQNWEKVVKKR